MTRAILPAQEEMEIDVEEPDTDGAGGAAGDNEEPEAPNARRRFLPSSIGLTVLLDPDVKEIEARISWGDYVTEPRLPEDVLLPEPVAKEIGEDGKPKRIDRPLVDWVRIPKERVVRLPVRDGRGDPIVVPESAAEQRRGGGLSIGDPFAPVQLHDAGRQDGARARADRVPRQSARQRASLLQ